MAPLVMSDQEIADLARHAIAAMPLLAALAVVAAVSVIAVLHR
jgi:hypothetical protein